MASRVVRCVLFSCAGLFLAASPALAQRDLEIPIQFDFINPGARSLALAGAFIGLADDATAATTNPAGLQRLGRPEVSIEGRGWKFITDFVQGGRLSGTVTNKGIDTTAGPVFADTSERVTGISFLSFVYPHGRWSIAGYRQEASRLKGSATTEGAFLTEPNQFGQLQEFREYPSILARELDVINYGSSVAYRFGKVSVGAGINFSQLKLDSALVGYELPPDFYGPATYTTPRFGSTQESDDWSLGFTGGVLIVPNDKFQVGASYRRGARFEFDGQFVYPDPQFSDLTATYTDEFKVPDNFGVGVAVRPFDGLTISFDINRVSYSDLQSFIRAQVRFNREDAEPLFDRGRHRSAPRRGIRADRRPLPAGAARRLLARVRALGNVCRRGSALSGDRHARHGGEALLGRRRHRAEPAFRSERRLRLLEAREHDVFLGHHSLLRRRPSETFSANHHALLRNSVRTAARSQFGLRLLRSRNTMSCRRSFASDYMARIST